jgi:hypothetical protein
MANGGERAPEELVAPESGLSFENVKKSNGEPVMGWDMVDLEVSRSSWMLEKLNQRLLSRSDCGSSIVGMAGVEDDDEGMAFERMSKSTNVEKSFESKTKGEGSRGLSSNMAGSGQGGSE